MLRVRKKQVQGIRRSCNAKEQRKEMVHEMKYRCREYKKRYGE
jgi:hypothetical protein